MRVLFIDIDTLRPDHLGCYGYHRATSPAIDAIATEAIRFDHCYASDTPCLPSRSALSTMQFGIRNGAINHGGAYADPFNEGAARGFRSDRAMNSLPMQLAKAGYRTASISSFPERHSAYHWCAGFRENLDPSGKGGMENAEEVIPTALEWLDRNGSADTWFLHVHIWDPHTPYRAPETMGNPFASSPLPAWYTEEVRQRHWDWCGPHGAQEVSGHAPSKWVEQFPRQPQEIASMADARRMFDGYDCGVLHADRHVAQLVERLKHLGIWEDTAIVITSDHGEDLGELNSYGDHQFADEITHRLPMIVRWPGLAPRAEAGLHYHLDVWAGIAELAGAESGRGWDGVSCAAALRAGRPSAGREHLVLSNAAWSHQRSARWGDWILIRSYHDGHHGFPDVMLFNLRDDPHQQHDLAPAHPELVDKGLAMIERWRSAALDRSPHGMDPMAASLAEGGPLHCRGQLQTYCERLRATGRAGWAEDLERKHAHRPRA
ncbi:MAG: sulfatase [Planctomycetes bacterium]|nr:sulfatase [Planctomycetota bacterium]